ncbi:hypothetical protein MLD38_013092 [Melastoma candidum]|uniref:Uncharacterized protein n=1 Tax=Melastoma candidum TaxID=119954 RepID=A0ACB9R9K1_9MYRT|nr:hypothetical protein MLD38_013092 [Melastoma candidum]
MAKEILMRDCSPKGQVRVLPSAQDYTFGLACRIFMNIKDDSQINKLSALFADITSSQFSVPINIPGTPFNRAVKGGKKMRKELINVIRKRKDEIERGEDSNARDLLTRLLKKAEVTEMEITKKIIGLLVASHETTSTAITMVINYLVQFPHIYNKVYAGNRHVFPI